MADFDEAIAYTLSQPPVHFAGREPELSTLRRELIEGGTRLVSIVGLDGIGKSALAQHFAQVHRDYFRGGISRVPPIMPNALSGVAVCDAVAWGRYESGAKDLPILIILEDCEVYQPERLRVAVTSVRDYMRNARIVLTSRQGFEWVDREIALGTLSQTEMARVWLSNNLQLTREEEARLYASVGGNPLFSTLAGRLVRDGHATIAEYEKYLQQFSAPGLRGPDGRPIASGSRHEHQIVSDITCASDRLLKSMEQDPDAIHLLTPRQFEEFVAALFRREGYQVELTPASKDGGKDIFVAKKDVLGSFLYLVECKKYARGHPVKVGLVRELYGVVEHERATAGVLATTSYFTRGAKEFTEKIQNRVSLRDYMDLRRWLEGAG
jgi:restriction system protein